MGRLDERLLNHGVHAQLDAVRAALNSLPDDARSLADDTAPEGAVARAYDTIDHVGGLLTAADPAFVWQGLLDSLMNQVSQMQAYVSQLAAQPAQVGPLDQATEGLMSIAAQMTGAIRITPATTKKINASVGRAITSTVRELRSELRDLEREMEEGRRRQAEMSAQALAQEEQKRAEIAARLDELRTAISAEKQRLDQVVPTFDSTFAQAQAQRDEQFKAAISDFSDESGELVQRVNDEASELSDRLRASVRKLVDDASLQAEGMLEHVSEKRDQVDRLYGVITNTGTASAFRDHAQEQKRQADIWRGMAVAFAIVAVAAAVWAAGHSDDSTHGLVARLAISAAAGAIAAYAGRQSSRHRGREEEARQLELDLTAFGPFIESLPEEKQQGAREELLKRIFVGRVRSHGDAITEESLGLMSEMVNLVIRAGRARPPG